MSKVAQDRLVLLRRALKIAKDALMRIENGCNDPMGVAEGARYEIMKIENQLAPMPAHETSRKL